jgi:hypothetical protein
VNWAFRAALNVILGSVALGDDPAPVRTWLLRQTALRRLDELGVSGPHAEAVLDMEPALGDAWLAYLALASTSVIDDLMGPSAGG